MYPLAKFKLLLIIPVTFADGKKLKLSDSLFLVRPMANQTIVVHSKNKNTRVLKFVAQESKESILVILQLMGLGFFLIFEQICKIGHFLNTRSVPHSLYQV